MKHFLLVFTLLVSLLSIGQQKSFTISGTLIAEDSKLPLESATVYLERAQDSSLVTYTISDKEGKFQLEDKTYDDALTLKAYDLLNQNTNARRTATADYIQDSQSTVLQRYFMVSFSWKFNSLGPKGNTGDSNFIFFD